MLLIWYQPYTNTTWTEQVPSREIERKRAAEEDIILLLWWQMLISYYNE